MRRLLGRRDFVKTVGLSCVSLAVPGCLHVKDNNKKRPNILILMADDWNWPHSAGFEDPVWTDGNWGYGVPGWDVFGPGGGSGTWNPDATGAIFYGYGGIAPEGQNVAWMEAGTDDLGASVDGGLVQVLTETLTVGMTYTLSVEVGNSYYYAWGEGYKIQLLAGGSVLAQDDSSQTPATDTFATSIVTYTYDSAQSALLGEPLEIRLLAKPGNGELDVDDVRLDAVPEPMTLSLLGLGGLGLIRRRRRA